MDTDLVGSLLDGQRPAVSRDITAWVAALDAIPTRDPEHAHGEADRILLAAAPPEVREAYQRVTARCSWWARS